MDRESYKKFHEMFVSNGNGTTLKEILIISFICPLSVLHVTKFDIWLGKSTCIKRLMVEFLILVGPLLLAFTDTFSQFDFVFVFLVAATFSNLLAPGHEEKTDNVKNAKLAFMTNYRAGMLLVTSLCILGVDFSAFPRRFAKTEEMGFGLMDIGVGSFVFSAGIVSPSKSHKFYGNLRKSVILIVLGLLKQYFVSMTNYHTHVSEYGLHWNFFMSMGIVQMVCGTLTCKIGQRLSLPLGLTLIGLFEFWLQKKSIYQWIFSLTMVQRQRSGFVIANLEGFVSLIGFSALYFCASGMKKVAYHLLDVNVWKKTVALLTMGWSLFVVLTNEGLVPPSSRRVCNLTYVVWMVLYNLTLMTWFSGVQLLTGKININQASLKEKSKFNLPFLGTSKTPWTYHCIAKRALLYFIVVNLLTGLVNMILQPALLPDFYAKPVLAWYSFTSLVIVCILELLSSNQKISD